jgi:hypothetical protein
VSRKRELTAEKREQASKKRELSPEKGGTGIPPKGTAVWQKKIADWQKGTADWQKETRAAQKGTSDFNQRRVRNQLLIFVRLRGKKTRGRGRHFHTRRRSLISLGRGIYSRGTTLQPHGKASWLIKKSRFCG